MEEIDLLEDVAPASNELGAITSMANFIFLLEDEIRLHEQILKDKKQELKKLAEQDLPTLMQELNIKNFTLSNGSKIEILDVVTGSVPSNTAIARAKDDDKEDLRLRQQQCFDWLRDNGHGSIIKNIVEVQFAKDEDDQCDEFASELRDRKMPYKRSEGVHNGTLNSVIKERLSEGKPIDLELFRVFTGSIAKIRR
jgi:hypothetical protein